MTLATDRESREREEWQPRASDPENHAIATQRDFGPMGMPASRSLLSSACQTDFRFLAGNDRRPAQLHQELGLVMASLRRVFTTIFSILGMHPLPFRPL